MTISISLRMAKTKKTNTLSMANPFFFLGGNGGGYDDLWSDYGFWPQSPVHSFAQPSVDPLGFDVPSNDSDSSFAPLADPPAERTDSTKVERSELSTEEIMRVAAAQYIQLSSLVVGDPTEIKLPFGLSLSDLSPYESKNVTLANMLLTAAEMVSNQEYDGANDLLAKCGTLSSSTGDSVQRVVHYFVDALQERIVRSPQRGSGVTHEDVRRGLLSLDPVQKIVREALPFSQVTNYTAIQTILDNVASANRIHIIDLSFRHGHQWTVLIEALASRTVDSVRITAVGAVEESLAFPGGSLSCYAKSLNVPFEFRTIVVPDLKDLRADMFEVEEGESVAIFNSLGFNNLIVAPECLENVMRVVCKIRPSVMMVVDVQARLNSQSFITRFSEALFFYSAYFDCLGSMMGGSDEYRRMIESRFFSKGIRSVLATEGSERVVRRVGVRVWKAYFRRFGILEADLSAWSMYQANLLLKQLVKDGSCTLERNGKALTVGWKGTPLHFVSAWKFQNKKKEDTAGRPAACLSDSRA